MLKIDTITKGYTTGAQHHDVLRGVSLELARGQSLALTGESGSGKSTLLHLAAALDGFDSGEIWLDGIAYSGLDDRARARLRRERIALVFQQFSLIPSLSVGDNIAFHARLANRFDPGWAEDVTHRLGLSDFVTRWPEALSGGQQQRVAIARALAARPDVLLADEPTGNLDEVTGHTVLELMLDMVAETGTALWLVTHSEAVASRLQRRMHLSEGRLT